MTLGERLKEAREKAGLDLKKAAELTKIQAKYLEQMELGQYEKLPAYVYARGFLKKYLQILGLPAEEFLAEYRPELEYLKSRNARLSPELPQLRQQKIFITPKLLTWMGIGILILMIFLYIGYQIYFLLSPPNLSLQNPAHDLTLYASSIEISGQTDASAKLTLNGQQVYIDKDGNFRQEVNLSPGVNTLQIIAENRFGKKSQITRQIIVSQ